MSGGSGEGVNGRNENKVFQGVNGRNEKKVFHKDLLSPLGVWEESEEMPQHVVCYRAGDGIMG